VLTPHGGVAGFPGDPKVERRLWERAEALLPRREIETYTQALMDLGATVCLRARPKCDACPVAQDCIARREGRTDELPAPRPNRPLPQRAVTVLLVERKGEVLLERRPSTGVWSGLWSLPELERGGDAAAHCRFRFGVIVSLQPALPPIEHRFTHFRLTLHPQPCAVRSAGSQAEEPGLLWLPLTDVSGAALPAPIKKLLREHAQSAS